jgi:hypothetical protein
MEVTTIHVLDLEDASGNMEVAYDNTVQVPVAVETLEVTASVLMSLILGRRSRGFFFSPFCHNIVNQVVV